MSKLTLALLFVLHAIGLACSAAGAEPTVGVVDERLLPRADWISAWSVDWEAATVATLFRSHGVRAQVIGTKELTDPAKLKAFDAVMIPTDHGYPDQGERNGPVARALAAYVRQGGIYILPMGASHSRWKDLATGVESEDMGARADFLNLHWQVVGNHIGPPVAIRISEAGTHAGLSIGLLPTNVPPYTRSFSEAGLAYATDDQGHPCLYATAVGAGFVVHYAGGLPLDSKVRDWLIASYSAILKTGIDAKAVRKATWGEMEKTPVYTTVPVSRREPANEITLGGTWELAQADSPNLYPEDGQVLNWTKVRMPNSIQNALFEAGKIPNPWFGDNAKEIRWISDHDWFLRRRFRIPAGWAGKHLRLRFDGMDYTGTVWLDGTPLGKHEGMLGGPTFDVSPDPNTEHELLVRIYAGKGYCSDVMKPDMLCGFSWWGNKYWSMGLWAPVRLVATGEAYLEAPLVRTESLKDGSAHLAAQAMILNTGSDFRGTIRARIEDPDGRVVWQGETTQVVPNGGSFWETSINLPKPRLWWPNGLGEHPLYRLRLALDSGKSPDDRIETRFGIRTLEIVRNPSYSESPRRVAMPDGADEGTVAKWNWEAADEAYRWLFVVNGRPFFAKGVAWLTSDDLLTLNPDRERWMIEAARAAGVRLFRLNGGTSLFESDRFYDQCDESGILVWQELPLNWADHSVPSLGVWRDQLTQSVLRIRRHPSLALYVGGNEFNPVTPGLSSVLGIAREIIAGFDDRPFRMSSPGAGRVGAPGGGTYHAYIIPDVWAGDPNNYLTIWGKGANFISEWSLYAFTNPTCFKRVIPETELADDRVGIDFEDFAKRHPFLTNVRFAEPQYARYAFQKASWYGDLRKASVSELAEYSQLAHAQTYGYVFEHWRADFPYKGGHSVWTWNGPEPTSTWGIFDWFGQPETSYYWVKRANESVHVMANTTWFSWGPGDTFHASLQAISDTAPIPKARMEARILDRTMRTVATKSWAIDLPGKEKPSPGREIKWAIPRDTPDSYFFLVVSLTDSAGRRLSQQTYWMRTLSKLADPAARKAWQTTPEPDPMCDKGPWLRPQLASLPTSLQMRIKDATSDGKQARVTLVVKNTGTRPAFPVKTAVSPGLYSSIWSDNFIWLEPGESRTLVGTIRVDMSGMDPVAKPPLARLEDLVIECGAWNTPTARLRVGSRPPSAPRP